MSNRNTLIVAFLSGCCVASDLTQYDGGEVSHCLPSRFMKGWRCFCLLHQVTYGSRLLEFWLKVSLLSQMLWRVSTNVYVRCLFIFIIISSKESIGAGFSTPTFVIHRVNIWRFLLYHVSHHFHHDSCSFLWEYFNWVVTSRDEFSVNTSSILGDSAMQYFFPC